MLNDLTHVILDPAHWLAEIVMDGTLTLLAVYPIRRLVARHDRVNHHRHTTKGRRRTKKGRR